MNPFEVGLSFANTLIDLTIKALLFVLGFALPFIAILVVIAIFCFICWLIYAALTGQFEKGK